MQEFYPWDGFGPSSCIHLPCPGCRFLVLLSWELRSRLIPGRLSARKRNKGVRLTRSRSSNGPDVGEEVQDGVP